MSDERTITYEGFFLFPQAVTANLQGAIDHLDELLKRVDAEVISLRKWDERRLAYEIKGNKRGVYFLVYFRADPARLTDLERACNLSEQLLRSMVTRADHIPADQVQAADGRAQLADEIRLRAGEDAAGGPPPTDERSARAEDIDEADKGEDDDENQDEDEPETVIAAPNADPEPSEKPTSD